MHVFEPVYAWQVTALGHLVKQICPKLQSKQTLHWKHDEISGKE